MADCPLVLLHGFPLAGAMWDAQVAAFGGRMPVRAPDLVGFGAEPPAGDDAALSLAGQAAHVLDLLADDGVEEFALCGLSMGGYIAFEVCRQAPSRVRGLVLTNTRATADSAEAAAARLAQAAAVRARGATALVEAYLPKLLAPGSYQSPHLVARIQAMIEANSVDGLLAGLEALRTRRDQTDILGSLSCPTLVVMATDDAITPAAEMRGMADAIPGARTALIAAAGHLAPMEQPAAWNDAVAAFLVAAGLA